MFEDLVKGGPYFVEHRRGGGELRHSSYTDGLDVFGKKLPFPSFAGYHDKIWSNLSGKDQRSMESIGRVLCEIFPWAEPFGRSRICDGFRTCYIRLVGHDRDDQAGHGVQDFEESWQALP